MLVDSSSGGLCFLEDDVDDVRVNNGEFVALGQLSGPHVRGVGSTGTNAVK